MTSRPRAFFDELRAHLAEGRAAADGARAFAAVRLLRDGAPLASVRRATPG